MTSYLEQVSRMRLRTVSPDGSVHAEHTAKGGVRVMPGDTSIWHDEITLAEQVNAAVRGLARGADQGHRAVQEKLWGEARKPVDPPADLSVQVDSPRGLVKAAVSGPHDIRVRIRPGTLRRADLSADLLYGEINTALADAVVKYGVAVFKARFDAARDR